MSGGGINGPAVCRQNFMRIPILYKWEKKIDLKEAQIITDMYNLWRLSYFVEFENPFCSQNKNSLKLKIDVFLFFMLINFLQNSNWHITKLCNNKYEKEWGQNWLKRIHCEKDYCQCFLYFEKNLWHIIHVLLLDQEKKNTAIYSHFLSYFFPLVPKKEHRVWYAKDLYKV